MSALRSAMGLAIVVLLVRCAAAQEGADSPVRGAGEAVSKASSSLGVRQDRVNALMKELTAKFEELQKSKAIEPAQAERLKNALKETAATRLETRMGEVVRLLDSSTFSTASEEQKRLIGDIKKLIAILTEDDDERKKEEERLRKWKEEIKQLIKEENRQRIESDRIAEKERTLADMAAQVKALEDLIKREQKIVDDTVKARGEGAQKFDKIADTQNKVRADTQRLAQAIRGREDSGEGAEGPAKDTEGKSGDGKSGEGKPGEGKSGEGKSGEGKSGEGKSGEGKSGEGKSGEGKSGEGKTGEGKSGEGKSGEGKSGEGKSGEGKSGEGKSGEGKSGESGGESGSQDGQQPGDQPGEKPLHRAIGEQQNAESNLGKGKGRAAEQNERDAIAQMKQALDELKKEQARIASLPPEAFDKMAKDQDRTADKTGDLEKQMAEASKGSGQGGEGGKEGQGSEGSESQPQPGQENVQQAQQNMQGASGNLKKQEPKQATRKQQKAVNDLKKALEEIERRLAQLRREMQAEKLAALEAHFRTMLEIQKPVTVATKNYDRIRAQRQWTRPELLDVSKLSVKERELSVMAQQALDILVEDGTSVIFPRVVEQLRDDLVSTSDLVKAHKTGSYTQGLQREIENTLKELIDALEQAQKQQEPSDQPPGDPPTGPEEEPPLLPTSAELKLLRSAQLRVNRRTKSFDDVRPEGSLDPVLREEVSKIARQQHQVAEMTRAMIERN
jgi:hypothetical protein